MPPPPPVPGPPQPPRMFGMPPPLPNQSMTAISPAMASTGPSLGGPSKIDPNQIPRPIPSSTVILHETRQGNQANLPPVCLAFSSWVYSIIINVACSLLILFLFMKPATSDYIVRDTGNCSPRFMRCTINQVEIWCGVWLTVHLWSSWVHKRPPFSWVLPWLSRKQIVVMYICYM